MMRRIIILMCFAWLLVNSCKEEDTDQALKTDNMAPGMLTNVKVQNIPGGATISYELPKDNDILYVEANYQLADGAKKNVKSSFNQRTLKVEGFAEQKQYMLQLVVVDKSGNRSAISHVEIAPQKPPIELITGSLAMSPDFGGVRFTWTNETKTPMALLIYGKDDKGDEILTDSYYSSETTGMFILRGQESVEKEFTVVIRDKWDNLSNRISKRIKPIYETKLDPSKFSDLGGTFKKNVSSSSIAAIWDGKKEDRGVEQTAVPWYVSFDLGTEAKLSRIIIWQIGWPFNDYGHYFASHNANLVNIYGSIKPNPNGQTDESWVLLKKCELIKPSGLPIGMGRSFMSEEDFDLAKNRGHEFIIPIESQNVRYIRVEPLRAWESSEGQFSELEFFGAPVTK